jgi:heme oxygenase
MFPSHSEPKVDLSQPTSLILRAGTTRLHDEISKSKNATRLTKGELDREEYVRYLMMLWHIYEYVRSCERVA